MADPELDPESRLPVTAIAELTERIADLCASGDAVAILEVSKMAARWMLVRAARLGQGGSAAGVDRVISGHLERIALSSTPLWSQAGGVRRSAPFWSSLDRGELDALADALTVASQASSEPWSSAFLVAMGVLSGERSSFPPELRDELESAIASVDQEHSSLARKLLLAVDRALASSVAAVPR